MVALVRHRQPKGAGTDRRDLPSGRQALLYPKGRQVAGFIEVPFNFSSGNSPLRIEE